MGYFQTATEHGVLELVLESPPANALSRKVIEELETIVNDLEGERTIKAVVLRGAGKFFSAGADIKEFQQVKNEKAFAQLSAAGQKLFTRIENFRIPFIAALHGAALGGGLELAMACHIRYAATGTKLGLPETNLGLIPGFSGTQRLPVLVGRAKACEMMLSGEPITADEAFSFGLVNKVVANDELIVEAKKLARKIAEKSAVSTASILELLQFANRGAFQEGNVRESELFGKAFASHDGQEGIKAFIEKRKPNFTDQ